MGDVRVNGFDERAAADRRLVDQLRAGGRLSPAQLDACLNEQRRRGGPALVSLISVVEELGLLSRAASPPRASDQALPPASTAPSAPFASSPQHATQLVTRHESRPAPASSASDADAAQRLGRYVIQGELGRGGMGIVYRAFDPQLRRDVAVKCLRVGVDERALARFESEGRAIARLHHPAIVAVHEVGRDPASGRPFLAMDFIDGETLEALLKRERVPPRRLAELGRELALALAHAHEAGVIHRDVKPENVLIDGEGRPRLTDFGLARDVSATQGLTATGQIIGTPSYMAPEQADGDRGEQGPATDVYGLGALLYRALAGRPPFTGRSYPELLRRVLIEEPQALRSIDARINADLETIVHRCLEKAPDARYGTARALAEELERFRDGDAILARPPGRGERIRRWARRNRALAIALGGLLAVTAGGVAVGVTLWRRGAEAREEVSRLAAERDEAIAAEQDALVAEQQALDGIVARVRSGEIELDSGGYERAVDEIAALHDPETATRLAAHLDQITDRLWTIRRGVYRRALRSEAAGTGDGGDPLDAAELEHAIDALRAAGSHLDRRTPRERATIENASRRVVAAARARGERVPHFAAIVRDAHAAALSRSERNLAALCSDALARLGPRAADATGALERHVFAESDAIRASRAGIALASIGTAEARGILANVGATQRHSSEFVERVGRWLERHGDELALPDGDDADALLARAPYLVARGDVAGALADLDRALELAPESAAIRGARARILWRAGRLDEALADVDRAVQLSPDRSEPHTLRGQIRQARGEHDLAREDFDAAVRLDRKDVRALRMRAAFRGRSGDTAGAIEDLTAALAREPNDVATLALRGEAHFHAGQIEGALADLERALQLDPINASALQWLGACLVMGGDTARGEAAIERALEAGPHVSEAWQARAHVRRVAGNHAGAAADLARAIELRPEEVRLRLDRAMCLHRAGDVAAAVAELDAAIEHSPRDGRVYLASGVIVAAHDNASRAQRDLTHALKLGQPHAALWLAALFGYVPPLGQIAGMPRWPAPIARHLLGELTPDDVVAAAAAEPANRRRGTLCEAYTYIGVWAERNGDLAGSRRAYQKAVDQKTPHYLEHLWAVTRLAGR